MEGKNSKETLDEDNKRREFFDKQGERLEFYDSLICQLGDIVKESARVAPPVSSIAARERVRCATARVPSRRTS